MDPEIVKKIDEALNLSRENNKILKSMRKAQQRARLMRVLYWVLIIGMGFVSYYLIQPYLGYLTSLSGAGTSGGSIQDQLKDGSYAKMLEQFKEMGN